MKSINDLIGSVKSSRKRTAVIYCTESFAPIIKQFKENFPELILFDCTNIYKGSLTFSASDLLNKIEEEAKDQPTIISNMETFIVSNSPNFSDQLAKLLVVREPLKPLFFVFYSKKIYRQFKDQYEAVELNRNNTFEI